MIDCNAVTPLSEWWKGESSCWCRGVWQLTMMEAKKMLRKSMSGIMASGKLWPHGKVCFSNNCPQTAGEWTPNGASAPEWHFLMVTGCDFSSLWRIGAPSQPAWMQRVRWLLTFKALTAECFSFREQLDRNYHIVGELLPSWAQHLYAKETCLSLQDKSHRAAMRSRVSCQI